MPDFRKAHFVTCSENPFRLTPPTAQANFDVNTVHEHTSADATTSKRVDDRPYPDPSFSEVFSALKDVFTQRKAQGLAFLELTNSELMLVKKSLFITVFACFAAFALSIVCWLLVNVAVGAILHTLGLSYVSIPFVLLVVNVVALYGLIRIARDAFQYVNLHRLIQTWRRVFE
ncbi:hypothetical protein [Alteromonas gracilis]|uniref:hypothetical protein n=1 Tax=Alteromonas gracilis TaxID=1479524 RepID=UPI003735172A